MLVVIAAAFSLFIGIQGGIVQDMRASVCVGSLLAASLPLWHPVRLPAPCFEETALSACQCGISCVFTLRYQVLNHVSAVECGLRLNVGMFLRYLRFKYSYRKLHQSDVYLCGATCASSALWCMIRWPQPPSVQSTFKGLFYIFTSSIARNFPSRFCS